MGVQRWKGLGLALILIGNLFVVGEGKAGDNQSYVLDYDESGLTLIWEPAAYVLSQELESGVFYSRLEMPGTELTAQPGAPEVPVFSRLIALPATGAVDFKITEIETEERALVFPLRPAESAVPVHLREGEIPTADVGPTVRSAEVKFYGQDVYYPEVWGALGPDQWMRDQRLALLQIYPVRVNSASRKIEVIRRIRIDVVFHQPISRPRPAFPSDPFVQALRGGVLNPESLGGMESSCCNKGNVDIQNRLPISNSLKVRVGGSGLYAVTYAMIQSAGVQPETVVPSTIQMRHGLNQEEVALRLEGMDDGTFNAGDRILFYAMPSMSRYTDEDAYFLSYNGSDGLRMGMRGGSPSGLPAGVSVRTAEAEMNRHYDSLYAGRDGDHWFWRDLNRPSAATGTFTLTLAAPAAGADAQLTLWLQGYTDPLPTPDHRVGVQFNGTAIGEISWNGAVGVTRTLAVTGSLLRTGINSVTLALPGLAGVSVEGMWVDALALGYGSTAGGSGPIEVSGTVGLSAYRSTGWASSDVAVYDITYPGTPGWLTGTVVSQESGLYTLSWGDEGSGSRRYLLVTPAQVKTPVGVTRAVIVNDPPGGADYLIIGPAAWMGAVAPLAMRYTTGGLRVVTATTEAIYDSYGAGRLSPEAIRSFLQHAYANWVKPAPLYVLLVGDGSSDPRRYGGNSSENVTVIPPYLAMVDPWIGETAADNRYVTVNGEDKLPDLLVGRLPAKSFTETQIMISKMLQYQTAPYAGDWNSRVVLVADDTQDELNFGASMDQVVAPYVTNPFTVTRRYCPGSNDWFDDCAAADATALHTALMADWNQGALLMHFAGHSSWQQWAAERLFHLDDVPSLRNPGRWPIMVEMTCFTGAFQRPEPTLDEDLVSSSNGAVAVWGATGLGIADGHDDLSAGFYRALFVDRVGTLGAATLAGKVRLAGTGMHLDLLDTYGVLGDPALPVNRTVVPWASKTYLPIVRR